MRQTQISSEIRLRNVETSRLASYNKDLSCQNVSDCLSERGSHRSGRSAMSRVASAGRVPTCYLGGRASQDLR